MLIKSKEPLDNGSRPRFRPSHRSIVISATAIALFIILLLGAAATPDSIVYPIESAHFSSSGFWSPEYNSERSYRWTKGLAHIRFPGLEGTSLLYVALQLSAPQEPQRSPVAAVVTTDIGSPLRFDIAPEWRTYHVLLNARSSDTPAFTLVTDTWRPMTDRRDLGVLSGQLQVRRLSPSHAIIAAERWLFLTSLTTLLALISWRIPQIGFIMVLPVLFLTFLALQAPDLFIRIIPTKWHIFVIIALFTLIVEGLHRYQSKKPYRNYIMVLFLIIYTISGLFTQSKFITTVKPTPFADLRHYERALLEALRGEGPYNDFIIGSAYLYPTPALFIIEIFRFINPFALRASIYFALNVILMLVMVYGISTMYGYKINQTWYWYVLCLSFAPFLELIYVGQINAITLFGIFLFFFFFYSSPLIGSFGLSMAVLTKVSPVLFFGHLIAQRKWKNFALAISITTLLMIAGNFRYKSSIIEYLSIIQWLTSQFVIDSNSQSFVSKAFMTNQWLQMNDIDSMRFLSDYRMIQWALSFYIIFIISFSNFILLTKKSSKEPAFLITGLGMTLLPNVMWYHHYIFFLLPILVWVCWQKFNGDVVKWCLTGLLIAQIDRFYLTTGLLVHIFGHVSILWILYQQITEFHAAKIVKKTLPDTETI